MSEDQSNYQHLINRLLNGEFEPEQRLRSEQLRHDYGVSASTMRELLFRLSSEGLVDFLEQRGFRMPKQSIERQHELTHMRILLECEGASLSLRHGGVAWEARLTAAHHELKHIEDHMHASQSTEALLPLWTEAELKFHRTLIEECGSDLLKTYHLQVFRRFRQQLANAAPMFTFAPENVDQHQSILEAAISRDEDLVKARIREHLCRNLDH